MTEEEKNIEDLFRDKFGNYKIEPSRKVWSNINKNLVLKDFLTFSFSNFNVWYSLFVVGMIAGLLFINSEYDESSHNLTESDYLHLESSSIEESEISEPEIDSLKEVHDIVIQLVAEPEDNHQLADLESLGADLTEPPQDSFRKHIPVLSDTTNQEPDEDYVPEIESEVKAVNSENELKANFYFNTIYGGCNNLQVQFINLSENAVGYNWNFGDGGSSSESNPVNFYERPGLYNVTLEVKSFDGSTKNASNTIEVYVKPSAAFEVSFEKGTGLGRTVCFYNYSQNADRYLWDFGDGNFSSDFNPTHTYFDPGNFNIVLTAISENDCEDVLKIEKIFSDEQYFIKFPNAFRPHTGESSDGSYIPGEPVTFVFYPQYKGVSEYQLSIYNKSGMLLFETNDISKGWNGYYNNRLVAPGVYIWKASGRYEDGQPFVQAGDVTIILPN
ncbi:MAG: PKD domain-containing protein [Bacteroidales bacterium]